MRAIGTIFKKELTGLISSPYFLVVCGLCALVMSWLFPLQVATFLQNLKGSIYSMQLPPQAQNLHYAVFLRHVGALNLILIFVVPALTMKLFSEEIKMRTLDLLLTSPVTALQIVLGKYFALLSSLLVLVLISFIYPLSVAPFAEVQWAPLIISFFGIFLIGAVYGAMGLFCSSLSGSAILSLVMAVILNISIWFLGSGSDVVDSSLGRAIFEHISLNVHLGTLVEGTLRTNGLIFFFSLIFLFCFLTERVVESSRWR
jgi:ABC-2 type transport system permease protein